MNPPGQRPSARSLGWPATALLVLYAALTWPTQGFDLVWDDLKEVRENPLLQAPLWEGLGAGQHAQMGIDVQRDSGLQPGHDSFRPVRFLSLKLDQALHGLSTAGLHLHNALLGLCGVLLAFLVARRWLSGARPDPAAVDRSALAVAAVFALHPLQVEPVAYVSARSDLLAGVFALLTTLLCLQAFERSGIARAARYGFAALALALSFFSKEAFLALPVCLGMLALSRGVLRAQLVPLLCLVAEVPLLLWVRAQFVHASGGDFFSAALRDLGGLYFQYVQIALAPFDCTIVRPASGALPWLGTGLLALLCLLPLWLGHLRVGPDGPDGPDNPDGPGAVLARRLAPCLGWSVLLLAPTAVAVQVTGVASDRYMYLPLFGLCLLVAEVFPHFGPPGAAAGVGSVDAADTNGQGDKDPARVARVARTRRAGAVVRWALSAVVCAWVLVSFVQVRVWRDDLALYAHATAVEPGSSAAHYGLGYAIARREGCPRALSHFEHAVQLDRDNARAWNNLSVCSMRMGDPTAAEAAVKQALRASEGLYPQAWHNMAGLHFAAGRVAQGCAAERRALEQRPGYGSALRSLAERCPTRATGR